MKSFVIMVFSIAASFAVCHLYAHSDSPYRGSFNWTRILIEEEKNEMDFTGLVFESTNAMKTKFLLKKGDVCFYLTDKQWIWHDLKDPAVIMVPVFCPAKGGGWAAPPSEQLKYQPR